MGSRPVALALRLVRVMRISLPLAAVLKRPADEPTRRSRSDEMDLEEYELTPFGRRPKRKWRRKLLVGMPLLGAAALAAWLLL